MKIQQAIEAPSLNSSQSVCAKAKNTIVKSFNGDADEPIDVLVRPSSARVGQASSSRNKIIAGARVCGGVIAGVGTLGLLVSLVPGAAAQHPDLAPIPAGDFDECTLHGLQIATSCGMAAVNAIVLGLPPATLAGAAALPLTTANCIWAIRRACMRLCIPYNSIWCN